MVDRGNAAGQVVVFLAEITKRMHMLDRSAGLVENMSRHLIRRIEETPTIVLWPHTEIVALEGDDHLESVRWRRKSQTEKTEEHKIRHVLVVTCAVPNTSWLGGCGALDTKGSLKLVMICRQKIGALLAGPLPVRHICSKPLCREFSRWATCGAATSSVLRPRCAKDQ